LVQLLVAASDELGSHLLEVIFAMGAKVANGVNLGEQLLLLLAIRELRNTILSAVLSGSYLK
jgi:hypothetical protein